MIAVIGDIGNKAFALPMVQAYPTDVNLAQLLAWSVADQALAYVPYTGNASGDFGVTRDLSVGRNSTIIGNEIVGGSLIVGGAAILGAVTGPITLTGALTASGAVQGSQFNIASTKVVGARDTGWTVGTGTPQKSTFATGSVTLPQLAGVVMALQTALIAHGLIGT